ncbi:PREDICTED: uncharacterized protein LOC109173053 [Ipomoea nil]|uniref:uncharacterized protein LOC109173053 n=1 Tax=Ipomoea nil TaxID=35883 RepID=UPI000900AEDA|nr:PREDICTED: uncharacterized protein LOC109173053 [Ipomoea nil]
MAAVWRPRMGVAAKELLNNTYLFQFFHDIDMQRVLNDGPWFFEQNRLVLAKTQPDIPPMVIPLNIADFWIQIHDLPLGFFSEKSISAIGNFIGEFISIDEAALSGWLKSFIRIQVRIDISKPLVSQKRIKRNGGDWSWISFKYERLPNFCFICGLIGHTEKFCVKLFEGFSPTMEKQFGPWLRAPNRRPSPVTGNRWVVSDQTERLTTTFPSGQSQDSVEGGTGAYPGRVQRSTQCTTFPVMQHVASGTAVQHTTTGNDINMEQVDNRIPSDGLVILDQKRRRTDTFGPDEEPNLGPTAEPTISPFDLNGPSIFPKNLPRAGPADQAHPEQ